jgi:hypothetical protein
MLPEDALDLFALTFHLRAQPPALDLDFAELAIERGEISPLPRRLGDCDAGDYGQQPGRVRQQEAEL